MRLKSILPILLFLLSVSLIQAQQDNPIANSSNGFYFGIDLILTTVDKWNFDENDLGLAIFEEAPLGGENTVSPVIGYRFGNGLRAELSYWRKDYYHGIERNNQPLTQSASYDTNIFSGRVKYDFSVFRDRLFLTPNLGMSYGNRIGTLRLNSNVNDLKRTSIYHRDNFVTIDLGIGANTKIYKNLYFSSNLVVMNGIDQVMTVRYDLADVSSNDQSRIESKGTTLAISIGLKYYL